ncbi:hypothetical protein QTP86_020318, partial [Hemibagrus guttatus]
SIHSINGTWIEVAGKLKYRCKYQPPFTSKQIYIGSLQQLWFNFTATVVNIEPSGLYSVAVYNLPPAPPEVRNKYEKHEMIQAPGCDDEWMRDHSTCLQNTHTQDLPTNEVPSTAPPTEGQLRRRMRSGYSRSVLDSAGSVGVLVVYPAVDSMFQNAVMAIADFLQNHRALNVIIDVWQRGSLAEQGPVRWLNSQVGCAEKVLIILPPQHTEFSTDTADLKPNMGHVITDYTVPASACELFSSALNLVASCAHDPQQHCKFLVVHLDHSGHRSAMPVELRGCKTLILPRDLEKLHQISSRKEVTISNCRSESYCCEDGAKKVRDAVQQFVSQRQKVRAEV